MAEEGAKDTRALQDLDRQSKRYPELSAMQMRELARELLRLLKRDLASECDRFGRWSCPDAADKIGAGNWAGGCLNETT